jgi:hypothetical protein
MFDQYRSYVQVELRSRKFWHPLFWFVIEAALINSWLLYKTTREKALLPLEYSLFTFRKSIALALAAEWESMGCRLKKCPLSPSKKMQASTQVRTHLLNFKQEELGTRYTSSDGHASFLKRIPLRDGSDLQKRQMRCRQCKTRRSCFWCSECEAPLCKDNCYREFHTLAAAQTPSKRQFKEGTSAETC